ncbi:hypothetical protein RB195_002586 [Necator americanus]|uniref:Uncharacterized protein n=1 Tax=Necator americanus TaxID=51031 RepID=A0ABR1DJQ8_NECAM
MPAGKGGDGGVQRLDIYNNDSTWVQRLDMGSVVRHDGSGSTTAARHDGGSTRAFSGSTWAAARQAAARHGQRLDKQRLDMAVAIDGWWTVGPN